MSLARRSASRFWLCIMLVMGMFLSQMALAADPPAGQARLFATVLRVRGDVVAIGSSGQRALREGAPVYVGERVRAGSNGEAMLRTADAGAVGVRPGVEFVAERFEAAGKPSDKSILRIVTGSLRVISGWIGLVNRNGHQVLTPTATIGIRGTDHEPYVMSADMAKATSYKEGTYDKVNRGRTALEVGEYSLEIEPGKVGFAAAPPPTFGKKKRALLTVLMPALLDKIPDFYVPGEFDAELDQFSVEVDDLSRRELERVGGSVVKPSVPAVLPAPSPAAPPGGDPPARPGAAPAQPQLQPKMVRWGAIRPISAAPGSKPWTMRLRALMPLPSSMLSRRTWWCMPRCATRKAA
jgi:hypothetical protein